MRFSGIFQTISFTVRKRFVNAFLPSPYTVGKPSKNAPKTAKKIRNACGKNPHPLPPSCGSQSPKNRFVRPFFGILQVLAPKTPARWPFSHSLCVFTESPASLAKGRAVHSSPAWIRFRIDAYPPFPYWMQRLIRLIVAVLISTSFTICS